MKVAIIGAGFCGLAIAWHLLNHQPAIPSLIVHLFDFKGIGQGASGISAGLLHPYAGAHAKPNWKGKEGFQATKELLNISSAALGRSVIAKDAGILRLALNQQQRLDFQRSANLHPDEIQWLDQASCQILAPGCARAEGIWIKHGLTVYSSLYLSGLWKSSERCGAVFQKRKIAALDDLKNEFDFTIVAAGSESQQFIECSFLSLNKVKGQVLELAWPQKITPLNCALNSQVYIIMTEARKSCLVGATYEKGFEEATEDINFASKEILPRAYELFPPLKDAEILNCFAGMRSVYNQHRPLIHRLSARQWILTGMGSKGLLYHALFAKQLVDDIYKEA